MPRYLLARVRQRGGNMPRYREYGQQSIAPMNFEGLQANVLLLEYGHGAGIENAVSSERGVYDDANLHIARGVAGVDRHVPFRGECAPGPEHLIQVRFQFCRPQKNVAIARK